MRLLKLARYSKVLVSNSCSIFAVQSTKENAKEKVGLIFEKGLDFILLLWYCCVLTGGTTNEKYDKRVMARKY